MRIPLLEKHSSTVEKLSARIAALASSRRDYKRVDSEHLGCPQCGEQFFSRERLRLKLALRIVRGLSPFVASYWKTRLPPIG